MSYFWMIIILLALAITLYNAYLIWKLMKAVYWIMTHVMVLPRGKTDSDYEAIKRMFGIASETAHDTFDDIVESDLTDLDGKE